MPELTGIPKTLLLTLRARADEHARPAALFRDPTAAAWSSQLAWDAEYAALYDERLQTSFAVRTRVYDDAVSRFVTSHPHPLIIELAAGLSTRYHRLGAPAYPYIEIDLPDVITLRRTLEAETDSHRFIGKSIFDLSWLADLPPAAPTNTLILAEGLMVFMQRDEIAHLIHSMQPHFPDATFLLDVGGGALETRSAPRFAQAGAPMAWFVQHESEIVDLGLDVINVWPTLAQFPPRWGRSPDETLPPAMRAVGLILETRFPTP